METIELDAVEVRYEVSGDGEPVICLHANPFVDWYLPLVERMPDYAMLRYTRRPLDDAPLTVGSDATTCRQLAEHLGWDQSHVIGHSAGALTAVQVAVDAPDLVHTLSLLEPAVAAPADSETASGPDPFAAIIQAYVAADYETATELFLTAVCGRGSRPILERAVPGAFEHAVEACEFFFGAEVPAINAAMASVFNPELAAIVERAGAQRRRRTIRGRLHPRCRIGPIVLAAGRALHAARRHALPDGGTARPHGRRASTLPPGTPHRVTLAGGPRPSAHRSAGRARCGRPPQSS